jgi:hypothetical protein
MTRRQMRGSTLVELPLVAILALLPLVLGIFQSVLLLRSHHLVSLAAGGAARAGAVDHARTSSMLTAFGEGLVPLLVDLSEVTEDGGPLDLVAAARVRGAAEALRFARIERLSPTAEDFADHGREFHGQRGIPNDALEHRDSAAGAQGGRSIQQANLLRIRVRYCHPLAVPFIDELLLAALRNLDRDPDAQRCYAEDRVPLAVTTSFPMQSEAWP